MSTKNVPQVMEEIGEIVIDHKSAINGALLNKLCTTKSLRSRSRMSKVVVEAVQIIPRADVPVVL